MKKGILIMSFALLLMTGCGNPALKDDGLYAVFNTTKGEFICKLFYDKAPITVGNFVGLAEGNIEFTDPKTNQPVKKPFYNGIIFHRVIKGFVIQGGCPLGTGTGGPGYEFADEFDNTLTHDGEGILSMANAGPNTNGSQFFVTLAETPHLNGRHAIFGKVVAGMDIVKKIAEVKVNDQSKPYEDVVIKELKIVRVGDAAKKFNAVDAFAKKDELLKKLEEQKEIKLQEFLAKLGVDSSKIITTKIGLKYLVTKEGKGKTPQKGETIVAHYTGYLFDGTKFDSSVDRGQPFETEIGVGRVIAGWDEAFLTMKEGEKRILILPYYLAYGERGYPPIIPPKATLIFDVELIKVKAAK